MQIFRKIRQVALDIVQLNKGEKLGCWKIEKKLGEGGFGAVYLVKDMSGQFGSGEYACKAEKATETVRVMKMEVFVLTELKRIGAKHFCELIDRGHIGNYNYLVMTLVGPSFHDLRKLYGDKEKQKFSLGCALSCGIKCVEAIEELHSVGYLHRDIKPGNFAVGKEDSRRVIMLDFGMARKYMDGQGRQRAPRWAAGFRGTVRYAPLIIFSNLLQTAPINSAKGHKKGRSLVKNAMLVFSMKVLVIIFFAISIVQTRIFNPSKLMVPNGNQELKRMAFVREIRAVEEKEKHEKPRPLRFGKRNSFFVPKIFFEF
uniref:Protein kinase domain-containing protein n=1 Tax=Panagrolaimus sp. JU765 TaxID=591449 RepID=A0AC34Q050_9BILA